MSQERKSVRPPRSFRKYLRNEKARLRRELPAGEAEAAIAQLVRARRRGDPAAGNRGAGQ